MAMEDVKLPSSEFSVKFQPARALYEFMLPSIKFNTKALLTVTGTNLFQMKTDIAGHPGELSMKFYSDHTYVNLDITGYSLRFNVHDWYQILGNVIIGNPSSSMVIRKSSESTNVHCLFGEGEGAQLIDLGKAEFVPTVPVHIIDPNSYVTVTMNGPKLSKFIESFSLAHGGSECVVRLVVNRPNISWVTEELHFNYIIKKWSVAVVPQFLAKNVEVLVRWDPELFEMIQSAAVGCGNVELSIFKKTAGHEFYEFCFLSIGGMMYTLKYLEQAQHTAP